MTSAIHPGFIVYLMGLDLFSLACVCLFSLIFLPVMIRAWREYHEKYSQSMPHLPRQTSEVSGIDCSCELMLARCARFPLLVCQPVWYHRVHCYGTIPVPYRFSFLLCLVSIHRFDQVSRTYRMKNVRQSARHHVGEKSGAIDCLIFASG